MGMCRPLLLLCSSYPATVCFGSIDNVGGWGIGIGSVHGDVNATYFVGQVDEQSQHLVKTTRECLDLAMAQVKPGMLYREVGNIIQRHATANNLSVVRSYCGHGIGKYVDYQPAHVVRGQSPIH
jgi:methionine aminopeptidase